MSENVFKKGTNRSAKYICDSFNSLMMIFFSCKLIAVFCRHLFKQCKRWSKIWSIEYFFLFWLICVPNQNMNDSYNKYTLLLFLVHSDIILPIQPWLNGLKEFRVAWHFRLFYNKCAVKTQLFGKQYDMKHKEYDRELSFSGISHLILEIHFDKGGVTIFAGVTRRV